jgi:outer membrane protein TolC
MRGLLAVALWLIATGASAGERLLTLEDAFRLALRNHETFRISQEALERVKILEDRAWALLLPTLRVEGRLTVYDQGLEFEFAGRGRVVFQAKNEFSGFGTFAMTLFDARSIPGLQQTRLQRKSAEESTAFTQSDLLYEVGRAYFGALAAQRLVEINKETLKVNEEHLRDARARLQAGELIKLAVTRAEIEVVKARRELVRAENALAATQALLAYLVGVAGPFRLHRPRAPDLPAGSVQGLKAEALRSRRDLSAARHEIDVAKKGVDMAWGSYIPNLSLLSSARATESTGFLGKVITSNTLFTLGWTIYDGGLRYAELKEKRSLLREATYKHALLTRQIERDVETAFLDLKTAEAALFASQKELELARENHAMVMARFRAGLATTIEAVDAATALATAEASVLREELNRDTMRVNLLRASGADPLRSMATTVSRTEEDPRVRGVLRRAPDASPFTTAGGR